MVFSLASGWQRLERLPYAKDNRCGSKDKLLTKLLAKLRAKPQKKHPKETAS